MLCAECGTNNHATNVFCESCGSRLGEVASRSVELPATNVGGGALDLREASPAGGPALIPGTSIALGDGEVVWRRYDVTQLRTREKGLGTLYVTDTRVIFFARARGKATRRSSALIQETKIEHITGLSAYVSRKLSLFWMLTAFIWTWFFLGSLASKNGGLILTTGVILAFSVWMLVRGAGRLGSVGVRIQSGSTEASPIGFGEFGETHGLIGQLLQTFASPLMALFGGASAFDVLLGLPTPDSERVISELGALIIDLQTKGSLAGSHWGVETS